MSSMYRRNIRQLLRFMALVITILMFCSSFISLTYDTYSSLYTTSSDLAGLYADTHGSFKPFEEQLTFTLLPEKLALQEIKPAQKIPGRKYYNPLQTVSSIQISSICSSSYLYSSTSHYGIKKKHTSVIAFLIGGHAPPFAQA